MCVGYIVIYMYVYIAYYMYIIHHIMHILIDDVFMDVFLGRKNPWEADPFPSKAQARPRRILSLGECRELELHTGDAPGGAVEISRINGGTNLVSTCKYHRFGHMNCGDIPWNLGQIYIYIYIYICFVFIYIYMVGTSNKSVPEMAIDWTSCIIVSPWENGDFTSQFLG